MAAPCCAAAADSLRRRGKILGHSPGCPTLLEHARRTIEQPMRARAELARAARGRAIIRSGGMSRDALAGIIAGELLCSPAAARAIAAQLDRPMAELFAPDYRTEGP
jgi:hypothetical protein